MPINDLDKTLIRCLQDDPRASYATIARTVEVSETTVKRRIESMIQSEVITTSVLPDLHKLGFRNSAIIGLKTNIDRIWEIGEQLTSFPEVTYVALVTGRYDVVFHVAASSMDQLTEFLAKRIAPIPGIRNVETMVMLRMLKGMRSWKLSPDEATAAEDNDK